MRHQRSVLAVTAFLFEDSAVGPYSELMFSVVVPPQASPWGEHPKAGFFPFLAAASSEEARRLKAERFHFPYHGGNIDAQFVESDSWARVRIFGSGSPILDMCVTAGHWAVERHLLQGYMMNGSERLRTTVEIGGDYTVHEEEKGRIELFAHPLTEELLSHEISRYPFREHSFRNGMEVFHKLESF